MEETLTLRDVANIIRRSVGMIASIVLIGVLAAFLFIFIVTPKFTGEAILKYDPGRFDIDAKRPTPNADFMSLLIAGEIAAIESPEVLLDVLRSEKLMDDPELNRMSLMGYLSAIANSVLGTVNPKADHALQMVEQLRKRLDISNPDQTNLIIISFESVVPGKAARVANAVAEVFLAQHLQNQVSSSPLAAQWVGERKDFLRRRWQEAEDRFEKFKKEKNLSYVSGDKLREQQVDRLNEQLVLASTKTEEARARSEQVRQLLKSRNYRQLADIVQSDVLTRLRERLAAASQRKASLSSKLLPAHPEIAQVMAEVESLGADIEREGRRLLDKLEIEFKSAKERETFIQRNFDNTIQSIQDSSTSIVKLRELQRAAESDRAIFEAFVNRANETFEQSTGELANFQLIQSAQVPLRPSFPAKSRILILAFFGSLFAGVGLAFLRHADADYFRSLTEVEALTSAPVAAIPLLSRSSAGARGLQKPELAVSLDSDSGFRRRISAMCQNFGLKKTSSTKIFAVTSACRGDGKTTIVASLALEAAANGAKVLLVDANWKHPRLARLFGAHTNGQNGKSGNGLSPIFERVVPNMDVLPAFHAARSNKRYSAIAEFAELLELARESYDLILMDTGAVLSDPDSCNLAKLADDVVVLYRWNTTSRSKSLQALEELRSCGVTVQGVVVNGYSAADVAIEQSNSAWPANQTHYAQNLRADALTGAVSSHGNGKTTETRTDDPEPRPVY